MVCVSTRSHATCKRKESLENVALLVFYLYNFNVERADIKIRANINLDDGSMHRIIINVAKSWLAGIACPAYFCNRGATASADR